MPFHTLHTFSSVTQSSALKLQTGAAAQQHFSADVFLVHPTATQASSEPGLANRPSNPIAVKTYFYGCHFFFQLTVSGFGGLLIGSPQCFLFGWADVPLTWHRCRPFLSLCLSLSISLHIALPSLSQTCSNASEVRGGGHTLNKNPMVGMVII